MSALARESVEDIRNYNEQRRLRYGLHVVCVRQSHEPCCAPNPQQYDLHTRAGSVWYFFSKPRAV